MLYGGVTEEILVRWGLMTLLVWALWRFLQGGAGEPADAIVWVGIALSAFVFRLAHLPVVGAHLGAALLATLCG